MLSKLVKMTNEVTNYKKQESNIINLLVPVVLLSLLLLFSIIYVCSEKNTSENEKNRMESQKNRIESEKNRIESEKNRIESEKNRKAVNKIKPGEELYVHYGITYWLIKNKIKIDSDKLSFYQEQEKDLLDRYLTSLDMYM